MKRIMILIAALVAVLPAANAQRISDIAVSDLKIIKNESLLDVDMDIDLSQLDVKSRRSVHLVPVLKNGNDSTVLSPIGIYSRGRYINYLRRGESVFEDLGEKVYKEGEEPKQEEPEVTEKVVYLKPNSNWTQSNARFAIYIWGGTAGEKWVSMTKLSDGTYEAHLPEGYDYGCNIIFCRMNPSTTANNWNNKWNQTSDLKTPTDGKNLYTVKAGTWDKGGGTWSVK